MSDAQIEIGPVDRTPEAAADPSTAPAAPQPSRSRLRVMVLTPLLVVAMTGVAALGWATWQVLAQKDATLATPARIGPLTLDDTEDGRSTADYLMTALAAEVDLDQSVGAVYRDGQGKNVLFLGGTTLFWTPESDLEAAFDLIADNSGAVTGLHEVAAGDLGGTMKCGTTSSEDGELPVCGWADHGSLALVMFPSRTAAEAPALTREIRDAIQSR
jgi:hypothetical protein